MLGFHRVDAPESPRPELLVPRVYAAEQRIVAFKETCTGFD